MEDGMEPGDSAGGGPWLGGSTGSGPWLEGSTGMDSEGESSRGNGLGKGRRNERSARGCEEVWGGL